MNLRQNREKLKQTLCNRKIDRDDLGRCMQRGIFAAGNDNVSKTVRKSMLKRKFLELGLNLRFD